MPYPRTPYRDRFFSGPYLYFERTLDAILMQRRAISQNIANANNPNYHPIHVKFQEQLEKLYNEFWDAHEDNPDGLQMRPIQFDFDPEFQAEDSSSEKIQPTVIRDPVNRVDLNHEMGELYKTQMLYTAMAENGRPTYGKDVLDVLLK